MRSVDDGGQFGNQCTYDKEGKLITSGLGAGTVDNRYYGESIYDTWVFEKGDEASARFRHFHHDVVPFWTAWLLDGKKYGKNVAKYLEVRPSHHDNCPENQVGGLPDENGC